MPGKQRSLFFPQGVGFMPLLLSLLKPFQPVDTKLIFCLSGSWIFIELEFGLKHTALVFSHKIWRSWL